MWKRIVIHHTAAPDADLLDAEAIRRYHMAPVPLGRGWSDIGYHFIVERVRGIYVALMARPLYRVGAHTAGRNIGSIGVALAGDYSSEPPATGQLFIAAELCAGLCASLSIPTSEIHPHSAYRDTLCPGAVDVQRIRSLVSELRSGRYARASDIEGEA